MYIKTRGLVLQTIKYSETSVIARIFTEQLGLVSYMVNGVRSAKSLNKAAMMRPLSLLEMDVTHRENKGLQRIKEFKRAYQYQSLPFDTLKSSVALFLLEVISKTLKEHDPHEELFEFVYEHLRFIDEAEKLATDFHLQFLLHYTHLLGFAPHNNFSAQQSCFNLQEGFFVENRFVSSSILNEELSLLIHQILNAPAMQPLATPLLRAQRKALLQAVLRYYQLHVEGFGNLKSHEVLEAVFG